MSGTNTIELYNKETDTVTEVRLYRVMSIGHLETPNEDAQYKAVLRACQPLEQRRNPTSRTGVTEHKVIIPNNFTDTIFDAFTKDCNVLAELSESCIITLVTLSGALRFNLTEYKKKHGEQTYRSMDGDM